MSLLDRLRALTPYLMPVTILAGTVPVALTACHSGTEDDAICSGCGCDDGGDVPSDGCCNGDCCEDGGCGCGENEGTDSFGRCPPSTQPVVTSAVTPKPLSGGTLFVASDGTTAVVSDPDRDRIQIVDLLSRALVSTMPMAKDAEPGRAIEDADGRFHVILRGSGSIATISRSPLQVTQVTPVCPAPRGIASADGNLYVVCAGGELVTLTAADAPEVSSTKVIGSDLRDIVSSGGKLFVSHFRSTQVDLIDGTGKLLKSVMPLGYQSQSQDINGLQPRFSPTVAWRMVARPSGGVLIIHQQAKTSQVLIPSDGGDTYGGQDCNSGIVHSAVTLLDADGNLVQDPGTGGLSAMPLPVDIATTTDGDVMAVVGAGNASVMESDFDGVFAGDGCANGFPQNNSNGGSLTNARVDSSEQGAVALAYDSADELIVQIREPAALEIHGRLSGGISGKVDLGGDAREDTGFTMFHGDADTFAPTITCASCHPEGRDDGHVWDFKDQGKRRTQSLAGNVIPTAPFHWAGT